MISVNETGFLPHVVKLAVSDKDGSFYIVDDNEREQLKTGVVSVYAGYDETAGHDVYRLDFSGVSFMDSSGIGLIMGRYRLMSLYGGIVRVSNVPESLERMMKISGLNALDIIERRGERIESTK